MTVYLYDSAGTWIAFRTSFDGRYLFDPRSDWIGWFPFGDDDAVSTDGAYLGTVVEDRLLWRIPQPYRVDPGYPGAPAFPGHVSYPGGVGYFGAVPGFADVPQELLAPTHATNTRSGSLFGT